jgi:RNA polymerase sigma-70 factor (ECF subfamily)
MAGSMAGDSDLVERIKNGDRKAEQELFVRFQPGVRQIVLRVTGSLLAAEDLSQEALIIALRRLRSATLEDPSKLAAFVSQTARNLAIAEKRKERRRRTDTGGENIDEVADVSVSQDGRAHAEASARVVRELLGELHADRDRQLLTRHYLNDEDKEVICRDLGISESAFNVALCRARQRFREILEKHGMTSENLLGSAPA